MEVSKLSFFHWGKVLFIFFTCYITFLVFVVYKSTTVDHSLVTPDYYQEDINYQSIYSQIENKNELTQDLTINQDENGRLMTIDFGIAQSAEVDVKFYRPSNENQDVDVSFSNVGKSLSIPIENLETGKWTAKIKWSNQGTEFYQEHHLFISRS